MARPWDSTLYIESHDPSFIRPPKCPECSDLRVPMVLREAVLSSTAVVVPPPAVPAVVAALLSAPALVEADAG